MQISWNEFRVSHPSKFDLLVSRLMKELGVGRDEAIDALDEDWTFEKLPNGDVRVTNDLTGRYSTIPPPRCT